VAWPNQLLTHRARINAPDLRGIAACGMVSATKAPLLRTAQQCSAVMSWRLMMFANPGRRWNSNYIGPAPDAKGRQPRLSLRGVSASRKSDKMNYDRFT
jgi:hypothetical protein